MTIISLWASNIVLAQSDFYHKDDSTKDNEGYVARTMDSVLIVAQNQMDFYGDNSTSEAFVTMFSPSGTIVQNVNLDFFIDGKPRSIIDMHVRNDSIFCLINQIYQTDSIVGEIIIIDRGFNLLNNQILNFNYLADHQPNYYGITLSGNQIYIYGMASKLQGPLLYHGVLEKRELSNLGVISDSLYKSGFLFTGFAHFEKNRNLVLDWNGNYFYLDSNLEIVDSVKVTQFTAMFAHGSHNFANYLIRSGERINTGFQVFTKDSLIIKNTLPSALNLPIRSAASSFDAIDADNCYYGVSYNWNSPDLQNKNHWVGIYKLDLFGNIAWQTHFGGDANYMLYSVCAAQDGGAYLVVNRYDWNTQNNERDLYIYKIDKNGSMLSQEEFGGLHEIKATAFPNPFAEEINISILQQQVQAFTAKLFSLDGRLVAQELFNQGVQEKYAFRVPGLPRGMYILQLENSKGETIYTEKLNKM